MLARSGIVKEGTEIEIVPKALPADAGNRDPRTFRATIGDVESRDSVLWSIDGKAYSASRLSHKLKDEQGMTWLANNIFVHWRIVGETLSMWDRAEALTRNQRFLGSGE